jgi:hypothetical protein
MTAPRNRPVNANPYATQSTPLRIFDCAITSTKPRAMATIGIAPQNECCDEDGVEEDAPRELAAVGPRPVV